MNGPHRPAGAHPFVRAPHRTMLRLSLPVLLSLVAEPLAGMADTAFVARLGAAPLAALGVGTVLLSSVFWIFNFLGIGTQTEVARADGAGDPERGRRKCSLALIISGLVGIALILAGVPLAAPAAALMGADGAVQQAATTYLRIRLLGAPAIILTATAFGGLRGRQDMRTPMWVALAINILNIALDAVLIFGLGPVPALGVAGAAAATTVSQWVGAAWALTAVRRRLGLSAHLNLRDTLDLFVVGRDLFLRTGLLTLFILLTTRNATRLGAEAGAAHQAIRQIWMLTALVLDAYAAAAQSLVGFFLGGNRRQEVRQVAWVACVWSVVTGVALAAGMWAAQGGIEALLVPPAARGVFADAWLVAAAFQPLNAISFATDGLHWGSGDYRFLRNAMLAASGLGGLGLVALDATGAGGLTGVWLVTGGWITIRAAFGTARIWPGVGRSPFAEPGATGTRA